MAGLLVAVVAASDRKPRRSPGAEVVPSAAGSDLQRTIVSYLWERDGEPFAAVAVAAAAAAAVVAEADQEA